MLIPPGHKGSRKKSYFLNGIKALPPPPTPPSLMQYVQNVHSCHNFWTHFFPDVFLPNYLIRFPPFNENNILQVRKVSNRAKYLKIFQVFFFMDVFPSHQKKILQAFSFFFLKTSFDELKKSPKSFQQGLILENFPNVFLKTSFHRTKSFF